MSLIDLNKLDFITPSYQSMDKEDLINTIEYKDNQIISLLNQISCIMIARTGNWETIKLGISSYKHKCSRCGYSTYSKKTNFCPDCGAKMQNHVLK